MFHSVIFDKIGVWDKQLVGENLRTKKSNTGKKLKICRTGLTASGLVALSGTLQCSTVKPRAATNAQLWVTVITGQETLRSSENH